MSTGAVSAGLPARDPSGSLSPTRTSAFALAISTSLAAAVAGAGLLTDEALPVVAGASAFLFLAVASDVRSFRVPNLLTLPALLAALLASPWIGGAGGPIGALLGAAVGFGVLLVPYAVGGMGAGDVKALMALGAWLGPASVLGAVAWSLLAAGIVGVAVLALRGDLTSFAARWGRNLLASLSLRRVVYEGPAEGSTAAGGIPFAAALAAGLATQWAAGAPW